MRLVLATFGSLGDLHPFLAVGKGLRQRGHEVIVATSAIYRDKVEREGMIFAPLRPDLPPIEESQAMIAKIMDGKTGGHYLYRNLLMPAIAEQYADLDAVLGDADLLINHTVVHAGPLAAQKRRLPFLSVVLQPMLFASAYDPPIPPTHPGATWIGKIPPPLMRRLIAYGKRHVRPWVREVDTLRQGLGLPPGEHPIFEGQHSPHGTLALFSRALGAAQPDWPAQVTVCGFPFYDSLAGGVASALGAGLEGFLVSGEAPLLFTLGSSAVAAAGDFYVLAVEAARSLNRRAMLLTGRDQPVPTGLPPGIIAVDYAPHSLVMPRCAAIVHQGGVGTTGQALRAGRPQVIVPYSHDQPDNAWRITRQGAGLTVPRGALDGRRLRDALHRVLDTPSFSDAARALAAIVAAENGVEAACDTVEALRSTR